MTKEINLYSIFHDFSLAVLNGPAFLVENRNRDDSLLFPDYMLHMIKG